MHDLAIAIEYETLFMRDLEEIMCDGYANDNLAREDYYWEYIARPFARSH